MSRRRLAQIALAAASLLLSVVVLDRLIVRFVPLGTTIYRLHSEWLYESIPGASKIYIHDADNGGHWVRVDIGPDGWRGPPLVRDGERPRILVYGDSFVAAEFSRLEETWVAQLADALERRTGRPVETINAGLVGIGPDQVARRMPGDLERVAPDVAIVAITSANDFGDLVRNKLYALDADGTLVARNPEVGPAIAAGLEPWWLAGSGWALLGRAAWRGAPLRLGSLGLGEDASAVTAPSLPELLRDREREAHNAFVRGDPVARNLFEDGYDADVSARPRSASAETKRRLMDGVVAELARTARRAGVPLLVVAIPSPVDVLDDHHGVALPQRFASAYRRDALTRAVVSSAERAGLPVLDLYGPMRAHDAPASLFFRGGNDHWNERGQRLAAELTADRLVALGWLDAVDGAATRD